MGGCAAKWELLLLIATRDTPLEARKIAAALDIDWREQARVKGRMIVMIASQQTELDKR